MSSKLEPTYANSLAAVSVIDNVPRISMNIETDPFTFEAGKHFFSSFLFKGPSALEEVMLKVAGSSA